jgi:hypothetical protein
MPFVPAHALIEAKGFDPNGRTTWLFTKISPAYSKIAYGLCDVGMGCPELGYMDDSSLAAVCIRHDLRLEIDRNFRATKFLSRYSAEARRRGQIGT